MLEQKRIESAVKHYEEIRDQLNFAKEIQAATREWLTDPETGRITLIPRADEIEITYLDWAEVNQRGEPKKCEALLSDLILNIQQIRSSFDYRSATIKSIDIREYALKTIDVMDKILDKFAKIDGHYQKERENDEKLSRVSKAFLHFVEDQKLTTNSENVLWLQRFAQQSGVDLKRLAERVSVKIS